MPATSARSSHSRPGEQHGAARLTERDVVRLRDLARQVLTQRVGRKNPRTQRVHAPLRGTDVFTRCAQRHGVTRSAICMAVYGDTWRHVPGALPKPARAR